MGATKEAFYDLPLFRAADPETSREGAKHITVKAGSQAMTLLGEYNRFRLNGLTDEEACTAAQLAVGGWKRCSDLRRLGFIEPTGDTRPGVSGVNQRVCRITQAGIEAVK